MASTVEDFWRMIVEHNICTMVQLTADETVDNFKYWSPTDLPGSESSYGAMKVTLVTILIIFYIHLRTGVSKVRPTGLIRPAEASYPAREVVFSILGNINFT